MIMAGIVNAEVCIGLRAKIMLANTPAWECMLVVVAHYNIRLKVARKLVSLVIR